MPFMVPSPVRETVSCNSIIALPNVLWFAAQGAIRNGVVILGMDAEATARLEALEEFHPNTKRRVRQSVQVDVKVGDLELTVGSFIKAI